MLTAHSDSSFNQKRVANVVVFGHAVIDTTNE